MREEDVKKNPELMILAKSREAGIFLVMSRDGRQIFMQGHPEYDRMTLNNEYHRDLKKGMNPEIPYNYYEDNDPFSIPALKWRNMANTLYTNWLNFYVYQVTPYLLEATGRKPKNNISVREGVLQNRKQSWRKYIEHVFGRFENVGVGGMDGVEKLSDRDRVVIFTEARPLQFLLRDILRLPLPERRSDTLK